MANKERIIEMVSHEANSFMGINKQSKVFIDFSGRKKTEGFTELAGPQGTNKTSTLRGLAYALGARFNIDKKKLINSIDGTIDETTIIKIDKEKFKIETSASRVTIKKEIGGDDKWTTKGIDQAPQEFLSDALGRVIFIPAEVQYMDGKKQILYFQEMFASGEDAGKKMKEIETKIEQKFSDRRDINREVNSLKSALELEPLYQNYEKSQTRFSKLISADKEKKAYDEKAKNNSDYNRYAENLNILKASHRDAVSEIERLKAALVAAEQQEKELSDRVKKGDKWMEDNKNVPKEFEAANKEWLNLSQTLADQEKWKDIQRREKSYNEKTEQSMTLTGELDTLREDMLKLTKRYLPKVPGLSIQVAAGLDKKDAYEGVVYKVPGKKEEQPLHELSESEYEDMWLKILEAEDAQFVFLENMSRFGNNVVDTLNRMVKKGANVFYTLMDRDKEEIGISFKSKIE